VSGLTPSGRVEREKRIGDYLYRCVPLRGEDVLDVMVLVCRNLSPLASEEVVGAMLSGQVQTGAAQAALGGSLSDVLRQLRSEDVQTLRRQLAAVSEVELTGEKGPRWVRVSEVFGEHFAGRPFEIVQWMLHAFSVSFPLFFLDSPSSPGPAPGLAGVPPSPSTSRGSSGG
jgi:hypothetical protein